MVSKLVVIIAVGVFIISGLGGYAHAQFDELISTRIGVIKFRGSPAVGSMYRLVSKPLRGRPSLRLPSLSPATTGGSLAVSSGGGTLSCTLAPGPFNGAVGWREFGNPAGSKGYKYLNNKALTTDPCKLVVVTENMIKVFAKGTGTLPVPLASGYPDVSTVLTLGTDNYIAVWTRPHLRSRETRLIKAKNQHLFDNGDGTITDCWNGLMWEKKDDAGGIHDVDNGYTWSTGDPWNPDGTAFTVFLPALNDTCDGDESTPCTDDSDCTGIGNGLCGHAGYRDWRIPEVSKYAGGAGELETILLEPYPCGTSPCVDSVFDNGCTGGCTVTTCSCTAAAQYWSSSPCSYPESFAYSVKFVDGGFYQSYTLLDHRVRAVRGGSPSAAFLDVTSGVLD